jgi:hypothetical protein
MQRGPDRGPFAWQQVLTALACFYSAALAWNRTAVDIDSDAEDHAPDEARYACMSRPWIRDVKATKPVDSWARAFERDDDTRGWRTS